MKRRRACNQRQRQPDKEGGSSGKRGVGHGRRPEKPRWEVPDKHVTVRDAEEGGGRRRRTGAGGEQPPDAASQRDDPTHSHHGLEEAHPEP